MKRHFHTVVFLATTASYSMAVAASGQSGAASEAKFDSALQRFGVNHDRKALREACKQASVSDAKFALPVFYLGVLDEADENWSLALQDFNRFLVLSKDAELSLKARQELIKLPLLIKEDLTPSGKLNRQYRQHLGYAGMLQKQGFGKEAFLEAAQAAKLLPKRWEAYAMASGIMSNQGDLKGATHFLELAITNIPASSMPKLNPLIEQIKRQSLAKGTPSSQR